MKPSKNIHEKPQVAPTSQAAVQPTMMQFKLDQLLSHETEAVPQKVIHEIDQLIQEASQVGDKRLPHISSRNLGRLLLRKTLLQLNIGKNLEAKRTLQEVLELKETKRVDTGESSKHQVQEISVPIFNEIMATLTSEEQGAIRDLRKGSSTVLALYGASSSSSLPLASITTHPSSSSQPPVDHKDQIIELKLQLEASMKLCERYQEKYLASRSGTREYQTVNKDCEVLKAQCDSDHQEKCQQLEAQFEARHAFEIQSLKKELESKHEEELGKLKEAHQREIESLKATLETVLETQNNILSHESAGDVEEEGCSSAPMSPISQTSISQTNTAIQNIRIQAPSAFYKSFYSRALSSRAEIIRPREGIRPDRKRKLPG